MTHQDYDAEPMRKNHQLNIEEYHYQPIVNKKYAHVKSKVHDLIHSNNASQNDHYRQSSIQNVEETEPEAVYVIPVNEPTRNTIKSSRSHPVNRTFSLEHTANVKSKSKKDKDEARPWFTWIVSIIQIGYFIAEIIYNGVLTHLPIDTSLSRTPLIGPSPYILINMGSSFSPCMHSISGITDNISSTSFPCPNNAQTGCTLSQLCGFNGVSNVPNQWFRFILPVFLHAGIVHIVFNLFSQFVVVADIEKKIGVIRVVIIYFISGIFGFVLGGNFGANGIPRVGCSGSIFAIFAISFLDLFYNWKKMKNPKVMLIIYIITLVFNLVLGLLPGIDNFSHLGGFVMGLLLGLAIMGSPKNIRRLKRKRVPGRPRTNLRKLGCWKKFFYKRPTSWWLWWIVRFITFAVAVTLFVIFTENFYSKRISCDGCKYISCLPVNGWCDLGQLNSSG